MAVMDWYIRKVLSFRLSNTQDVTLCVGGLEQALKRYGVPEIFNTDQGSQFTSLAGLVWTVVAVRQTIFLSSNCGVRSSTRTST